MLTLISIMKQGFWKFPQAIAPMAQWLVRTNVEQRCAGSNPACSTAGGKISCA